MIKTIILCLSIFGSQIFAYESPAYFVKKNLFSIDGYDFIREDESFPIVRDKLYDVVEEGTEQLSEDSYQKLIRITNPDTQKSQLFKTRVISNSDQALIVEATETKRHLFEEYDSGDGFWHRTYWCLEISYDIILEDGGKLCLNCRQTRKKKSEFDQNFLILPGDQIQILSALRQDEDFTRTNFQILITRDGQKIGVFGDKIPFIHSFGVWGTERRDNWHGKHENIYVAKKTARSNEDLFIDNLVQFYDVQGEWLMPHSSTYHFPPYSGMQFVFVELLNDNEVVLKPYHSDTMIKFVHHKN